MTPEKPAVEAAEDAREREDEGTAAEARVDPAAPVSEAADDPADEAPDDAPDAAAAETGDSAEAAEAPEVGEAGEEPDAPADPEAAARALEGTVEAILFSSEVPLNAKRLAELARTSGREVLEAVDRLNVFYGETGRAFRIAPLAGGFQLVTTPDHADLLARLRREHVPTRLSRAALETLSIISFKQPVTRAEIDAIRGVSASDRVLRHLIERKLVRIAGRAEAPGRPLLYGTTREFLAYFGLSSVRDLPRTDELEALLAGDVPRPDPEDDDLPEEVAAWAEETAAASADPGEPPVAHSGEEPDTGDRTDSP